jgi:hypothetical protein
MTGWLNGPSATWRRTRMTIKRIKRPRDPVALAKLIGDIATGQVEDSADDGENAAAAELGRRVPRRGRPI